ncbi:hypothetical protein HYQ46_007405 [Verticillium longisporum]|nr:hypothetical protein HYQ46_007405 [Verticillium longisporum]
MFGSALTVVTKASCRFTLGSRIRRDAKEPVAFLGRNISIVGGSDDDQAQPRLGQMHQTLQTRDGVPLFPDDVPLHPVQQPRPRVEGSQEMEDASGGVAAQHLGERAEASNEHYTGKLDAFGGIALGDTAGYCRAEALSEDDDAVGRDPSNVDDPIDQSSRILDETGLRGCTR